MHEVVFHLMKSADLEVVWQILERRGCQLLYSVQENDDQQIVGYLPQEVNVDTILQEYNFVRAITFAPLLTIDWEAQWAEHGLGYRDGYLHVDLRDYVPEISQQRWPHLLKLKPGPGFGDLSHVTTRLVLKLMSKYVAKQYVLDVGCGSGVLSLAALGMGATAVCGIDIDEQALEHATLNGRLNEMQELLTFVLPKECKYWLSPHEPLVALMNMIQTEQTQAWKSLGSIQQRVAWIITSGVLQEEREEYLRRCKRWGWHLIEEKEESGWLGFVFKMARK